MQNSTDAAENSLTISRDAAWDRWHRAMMLFVGKGKRHTVDEARKGTGISASVVYGWLAGPTSQDWRNPHLGHVLSVMGFLGPEFSTEIVKLASQGAFWLPDTDETPPGVVAADLSEDTAAVTRAAADGKFDAAERRALGPVGRHLMVVGAQLELAGRGA